MSDRDDPVRVLCVDDDASLVELTAEMLQLRDPGFEPITAESGAEALGVLDRRAVDCVVSDYDMPGMDGLDLLSAVRDAHPNLPFVLFTAKGSESIASEAISAGVTEYLQKTSGTEQYDLLANRVRNCAERARESRRRERIERWYRRLFDQDLVGAGISQDGVFLEVNRRFAEVLGYEPEAIVDEPVTEFIVPEDHPRVEHAIRRRERGETDRIHYVLGGRHADGHTVDLEVNGSRVDYRGDSAVLGLIRPFEADRFRPNANGSVPASVAVNVRNARRELSGVEVDAPGVGAARDALDEAVDALESGEADGATVAPVVPDAVAREAVARAAVGEEVSVEAPDDETVRVARSGLTAFLVDVLEVVADDAADDPSLVVASSDGGITVRVEGVDEPPQPDGSDAHVDPIARAERRDDWTVSATVEPNGVAYDVRP